MTFASRVLGGFPGSQSGVGITQPLTKVSTGLTAGKIKVPGFEDGIGNTAVITAKGTVTPVIGGLPNTGFVGPLYGYYSLGNPFRLIFAPQIFWTFGAEGIITLVIANTLIGTRTSSSAGAPGPPYWLSGDNFWFGLSPLIPGVGNGYYIRIQQQSGSGTISQFTQTGPQTWVSSYLNNNSWYRLDNQFSFGIQGTGGEDPFLGRGVFKFSISNKADGSNIIYTVSNNSIGGS